MRVLFVTSRFPYPLRCGDQVRGFHQLRILSRRHRVVLVSPRPDLRDGADALKAVEPFCEHIKIIPTPIWRRLARLAQIPFTSLPLQTQYLFDARFRDCVLGLLRDQPFDLMHVQMVRMAPVAEGLSPRVPTALDLIDALSVNMAQRARRAWSPQMFAAGWEARRIRNYEQALVEQYDQLLISSPVDRTAIGDFPNLHVVPNGVDLETHPFVTDGRDVATIVFTGTMWYFPNVDAATWFVNYVFPIVRQQVADVRLFIVGARPASAVQRLAHVPGVTVTGYVPSVQEYLSHATVAIAPMQSGSGMQFKAIEAMASGVPVVATPYALGGLEAIDGEHLLIARNAEDFAGALVRVMKDAQLRYRLTQNARKLVEQKYSWERTVETLESVYRLATEKHESSHLSNG